VQQKISGKPFLYPTVPAPGAEKLGDMMISRTLYFDQVLERALGDAGQVVLMGAGYDTRAYGSLRTEGVVWFELDQESVQGHKRDMLSRAGIDSAATTFVTVDFSVDDVFEKLAAAGFDPNVKTVFLWEGVTLYLTEQAVRKTMRDVRTHVPAGSVLLADFYADRMTAVAKSGALSKTLDYTDEGLGFSLPLTRSHESTLTTFVESEGLELGESFFMGSTDSKGPFMVVAEMVA